MVFDIKVIKLNCSRVSLLERWGSFSDVNYFNCGEFLLLEIVFKIEDEVLKRLGFRGRWTISAKNVTLFMDTSKNKDLSKINLLWMQAFRNIHNYTNRPETQWIWIIQYEKLWTLMIS